MTAAARRRSRRTRGVAMLEFALVVPLLMIIVAGVVDLSLAWRKSLEVSSTLRSAVRVSANLGNDRSAEIQMLQSLNAGITEIGAANVKRVIVYRATSANGDVPAGCLSLAIPNASGNGGGRNDGQGRCNVYGPAQLAAATSGSTRFSGSTTACQSDDWDQFFCPTAREDRQIVGADYVGIWIEVEYRFPVGMLPWNSLTIRDNVVMRIEPPVSLP